MNNRIAISLPPRLIPQILAKNKHTIERHTQVPSMFIVAPRGITKEDTFCGIPSWRLQNLNVSGIAAKLEPFKNTSFIIGIYFRKNRIGFTLIFTIKKMQ